MSVGYDTAVLVNRISSRFGGVGSESRLKGLIGLTSLGVGSLISIFESGQFRFSVVQYNFFPFLGQLGHS